MQREETAIVPEPRGAYLPIKQRIDLNARFIGTRHEAAIEDTGLMVVEDLKQLRTGSTFLPNHKSLAGKMWNIRFCRELLEASQRNRRRTP